MKKYLLLALFLMLIKFTNSQVLGIDVYAGQGQIDWSKVYSGNQPKTFAFVKATKGTCYTDSKFSANMKNGIAAGVKMGAYDFALPEDNTGVNEANYFLRVASNYIGAGFLPPVLDLEDPAGTCIIHNQPLTSYFSSSQLTTWVLDWMTTVKNATGIEPIIYINGSLAKFLGSSLNTYKLWIANPDNCQTCPPSSIGKWPTWTFKQYSWNGNVAGVTPIDLDVFNGDLQAFDKLLKGSSGFPDLIITPGSQSVSATTATAGSQISVYASEENIGTDTSAYSAVGLWLSSTDTLRTANAVYLGAITGYPILPTSSISSVLNTTITIPLNTPSGQYYLFYWADGNQAVAESNETNNFVSIPITIQPCIWPDQPVITGPNKICQGDNAVLTVKQCNGCSYKWSDGAQGFSNLVHPSATTYYTVTTANNCASTVSSPFSLFVGPFPSGPMTGRDTVQYNTSYHYSILPVLGATSYNWQTIAGNGADVNINTPNPFVDITWVQTKFNLDYLFVTVNDNLCGQGQPSGKTIRFYTPLAANLISFDAGKDADNVLIKWQVAEEVNMDSYEIQRSTNGTIYSSIGSVKAKNFKIKHDYLFIDQNILKSSGAAIYYRLKQISKESIVKYSETITIKNTKNPVDSISLLYNTFKGQLQVKYTLQKAQAVGFRIIDLTGKIRFTKTLNINYGDGIVELNSLGHLNTGYYYIQINYAGKVESYKIYKQ